MKTQRENDDSAIEEPPSKTRKVSNSTAESSSESIKLQQLLDLSTLAQVSGISSRFDAIADELLHRYHIQVSSGGIVTKFEILELEFYLYKIGSHEDPFTHGSNEQRKSGQW